MKKIILTLGVTLSVLSSNYIYAQRTVTVDHINEDKINNKGYYAHNLNLNNTHNIPQFEIVNIKSSAVIKFPNSIIPTTEVIPDIYLGKERKELVATLHIPLYISKNGGVEKIESFDIKIIGEDTVKPTLIKRSYVNNSVLNTGNWFKIGISARGIYKIDYSFLQSINANPSTINPNNIRLYGHGGTVLSEKVVDTDPDDLVENSIQVVSNGSTFQPGDYILFYANGPIKWTNNNGSFVHENNLYEQEAFYFLNFDQGPGKRVTNMNNTGSATQTFTQYNAYQAIDIDSINLGNIGKKWFSSPMLSANNVSASQSFNINLGTIIGDVTIESEVGAKDPISNSNMIFKINNVNTDIFNFNRMGSSDYYSERASIKKQTLTSGNQNIQLTYTTSGKGTAYLNFLRFNYLSNITLTNNQLQFRNLGAALLAPTSNAGYQVANATSATQVWDVTNSLAPKSVNGSLNGTTYNFVTPGGQANEYIAFNTTGFMNPIFHEKLANQNLHALSQPDMLILTNSNFSNYAEQIAQLHRTKDGMTVHVVDVKKIYNEFSSGGQDISAIRNFIRMFYERATNDDDMIKHVLLFGAGSFDYKDRINNNTNFVPVYETLNSSRSESSFSSDDFYGFLDEGEDINSNTSGKLDIGIGRIPVYNPTEAQGAVDKIKNYISSNSFGDWKNNISFVTDNYEFGYFFTKYGEELSNEVQSANLNFNSYKYFTDASRQVPTATGIKYPSVTQGISSQIYNGTLLMNYTGHGSPERWAVEALLQRSDVEKWSNINKLPIIVTATCDFGRFDNPTDTSVGTYMFTKADGGAIALITTTQLVYNEENISLNKIYLKNQFSKLDQDYRSMGEALRVSKNEHGVGNNVNFNSRKFVLLGDPALKPALPIHNVQTDSLFQIDQQDNRIVTDTLNALGNYVIKGHVSDKNNVILNDFNGNVLVSIFDKEKLMTATNPELLASTDPHTYSNQTSALFKGKASVKNGKFEINVIIPRDINYDMGNAKISYYAYNDVLDAVGTDTNIQVGGFSTFAQPDNTPPVIKPFIDNNKFLNGGVVSTDPILYVELSDDQGMNVSGSSIGHDLVAIIDDDNANPIILNNYYEPDLNTSKSGKLYFQLNKIAPGEHTILVKGWDVQNNSGTGIVNFKVVNSDTAAIEVYNYPNPFTEETNIVIQHNQPNTLMDISLVIYNAAGQIVHKDNFNQKTQGSFTSFKWNGTNKGASLMKGVYFYKVNIKTEKGLTTEANQKLILLK